MSAPARIVKQFGEWAVCQDAQGEFYQNTTTGQSYDQPPQELLQIVQQQQQQPQAAAQTYGAPPAHATQQPQQAQGAARVVRTVGKWSICEDAQGEFYCDTTTNQTYDQPPPELLALVRQQAAPVSAPAPAPAPAAVPQQQQVQVLEQIGEWAVCVDSKGEFYYNSTTRQSYDTPPPELVRLYQQKQAQKAAPASYAQQTQQYAQPSAQQYAQPAQYMSAGAASQYQPAQYQARPPQQQYGNYTQQYGGRQF